MRTLIMVASKVLVALVADTMDTILRLRVRGLWPKLR